ncbi:MAG TPA: phosphoribosylglycinamide formyltransferase [Halothiobacillaceae bacterium]|nr:phosphoribosylglycinamide formyltransferase [Halothiobacillaceae bacterium]
MMPENPHTPKTPARVAVLASGSGSNFQALLDAAENKQLDADIGLLIVNEPEAYAIERARNAGIEHAVINHRDYPDRAAFDRAVADRLCQYQPDWIVLAGFMRILTDAFVEQFHGRMINIHPSLLPRYPGLDTHQRALENGDHEHGVTVHFVTPTVDAGPIIAQASLPIHENDTPESLKQRVHILEHRIYPHSLQRLIKGQTDFNHAMRNKPVFFTEAELLDRNLD